MSSFNVLQIESRPLDVEYVKLFHEIYVDDIPGHIYRGYALMTPNDDKITRSVQVSMIILGQSKN